MPEGESVALARLRQRSGKIVGAFAVEGACDPQMIRRNTFVMKQGRQQEFPEVDRAGWFPLEAAEQKLLVAQVALVEELANLLAQRERPR